MRLSSFIRVVKQWRKKEWDNQSKWQTWKQTDNVWLEILKHTGQGKSGVNDRKILKHILTIFSCREWKDVSDSD